MVLAEVKTVALVAFNKFTHLLMHWESSWYTNTDNFAQDMVLYK